MLLYISAKRGHLLFSEDGGFRLSWETLPALMLSQLFEELLYVAMCRTICQSGGWEGESSQLQHIPVQTKGQELYIVCTLWRIEWDENLVFT